MALPSMGCTDVPSVAKPVVTVSNRENKVIKKHVVHTIGQLRRGGAEKQLTLLALALRARGWSQTVISFSRSGHWKNILADGGILVHEIPPSPAKPYRWWKSNQLIRHENPELLMAWSLYTGVYTSYLIGCGRVTRVQGIRGDLTADNNTGLVSDQLRWKRVAIQAADLIISNSRRSIDTLRSVDLKIPHTLVIPNIAAARGRAEPANNAETPRIVAVGTLKRLKGFDVLLRALASLHHDGHRFELLVAGEGPERDNLLRLTSNLGLAHCVHLLGEISDVPALLASAHLAVHPSRSEGLSNAILEAMAEGLPVVATAVGGTPEMILDGVRGLLVPPDDPSALESAVRKLLRYSQLRGRMGRSALAWVRHNCSETAVADAYATAFSHAIIRSRGYKA